MKKIFTFSFLIGILIFALNANAQLVTISATHQFPVVGDSVYYQDANTFGFDATGVGPVTAKVWDFSALMSQPTNYSVVFVNPSTVPASYGRDSFPNATIARRQSDATGYFYYQNTASKINRIGWFGSNSNYGIYKNGTYATEFQFPITSGQNFNSTYKGSFAPFNVGEDSVKITDGTITISADMQGQMILPNGTFNGVLRIHAIESFHIKTYMMGMVVQDNVIADDYYYWFSDTILQPLFIYGITTVDGTAQPTVLRYQPISSPVEISEISNIETVNVYPNPSQGIFTLNIPNNSNKIEVYNSVGQIIYQNNNPQINEIKIDLTQFSKGIYFVKVYSQDKVLVNKIEIQ